MTATKLVPYTPLRLRYLYVGLRFLIRDVNARRIENDILGVDSHILAMAKDRVNSLERNTLGLLDAGTLCKGVENAEHDEDQEGPPAVVQYPGGYHLM